MGNFSRAADMLGLVSLAGVWGLPASAETIAIACVANPALNAPAMTLVYEGEADGTLTITAPFGEIVLPATLERRSGTDEAGAQISAVGIRASGPATALMPDKSAIEACVTGKLSADQLADADIVFMTVMGCAGETPLASAPVVIDASAEVALTPDGGTFVGVTRTYPEPTELAIGTIALEAYPNCSREE
jgi:hypothetical protein